MRALKLGATMQAMSSVSQAPRPYGGIEPSERRAQRRKRLLNAGLEVFGTDGYAGSSIRSVSAAASLNSRYFYESFTDREDLLYYVYKRIVSEVAAAVVDVTTQAETIEEQAYEGLRVAWTILTEDPRKARVLALEVVGVSDRLERFRRENRHAFADILLQNSRAITGDLTGLDPVLTARSLMGAVLDLLVDWINGDLDATVEEIVEHFTRLFTAVVDAAIAEEPATRRPRRRRNTARPAPG
jgi:AcrR family transcriptional regulator